MSALGFGFLPSAESCLDSGSAARAALPGTERRIMSAAAQLAFDFRPPGLMQRRDVPACAKLFWSEIQCRGGSVTEAGVLELAVAIGVNKSTISRSAAVLESTGWMASAKRQGHPKTYRCLHGAALPESSTDQGQDKSQKADTQNADTQNADTQNADT